MALGADIVDDEAITDAAELLYLAVSPRYYADVYMQTMGMGDTEKSNFFQASFGVMKDIMQGKDLKSSASKKRLEEITRIDRRLNKLLTYAKKKGSNTLGALKNES